VEWIGLVRLRIGTGNEPSDSINSEKFILIYRVS
jgi:hypothetical protein